MGTETDKFTPISPGDAAAGSEGSSPLGGEGTARGTPRAASDPSHETADVMALLAAEAAAADKLRLRHLVELVEKGALDQDIFEAVVHGTVYFLHSDGPTSSLLHDFRLRYKCDLWAFESAPELLSAARARRPAAVVVGGVHAGAGLSQLLPELLVAAFGADPVPVVVISDRSSLMITFEVLTYPLLTFAASDGGPAAVVAALAHHVRVERTTAELKTGEAIKEQIGLSKAHAIQQRLLPRAIPAVSGLEIAAHYDPCQEVGGDYYDFIPQPDGRLALVCADVSGKGVAAAMVMVMFRSVLRLVARGGRSPHEVMRVTNRLVSKDMLRGMFVSAVYLVVNPRTHKVSVVNAGHMPPLLWPVAEASPAEMHVRGLAVGLVTGERFALATAPAEAALGPGDLLCLYTDGIVEAADPNGEQFGTQRLIEAVRAAGRVSAQRIARNVVGAMNAFCAGAPQHDDTTLIVIKAK